MQIESSGGPNSAFAKALPAVSILLGLLVITSALERSAAVSRLSFPAFYDDIGYFISGFDLYALYLKEGFSAVLLPLLHEHAPFQSLLAMLGDFVFGVGLWSAYLADGFLVIGLVLVLLLFTRSLQPIGRFSIVLYILSLPLIGNLVTEFRPDIFWGVLCGIAIYLILSTKFLRSRVYTYVTAIAVALALLAKPSASPATAALMGFTALLGIWLQRPLRARLINVGLATLIVLAIAGPFFAINAATLYHYIHLGLVEQYGIFDDERSFWTNAFFYSAGYINQVTLSSALWVGLFLFLWNSAVLYLNGRRDELLRYACFGLATLVAYLIPTIAPIKSTFFGSIFYGTFLFFTVRGLVLAFDCRAQPTRPALQRLNSGRSIGPALLIFLTIITFHGWTLMSETYSTVAPEWNRAADHLTQALERAVTAVHLPRPAIVFVTAPYPFSDANVSLLARWHGLNMEGDGGYYLTSLEEEKEHALRDDYVLISQEQIQRFPGAKLGLKLLEWIKSSDDFELLTHVDFKDGNHAFLFRKLATSISLGPGGDWIEHKGLILTILTDDLARRPYIVFGGDANYEVLGDNPKPHAVLTSGDGAPERELPAWLIAKGQKYEVVIDAHAAPLQPGRQYSLHVTFDRYFVPKALGINEDTRKLVVRMPAKIELQRTPPVEQ
jgi:hypothetical protein